MPDYSDYKATIKLLETSQDAEKSNRALVKEDHKFIDEPNGQWEQDWWDKNDGKPRYTFDQVSPIIDQIAGDIEESNFDIKIDPAGGGASEVEAELRDGILRNIENISYAQNIYANAGRNVATGGLDHWMVTTAFVNDNSFNKDIIIEPIYDSWDRVWFDIGSQKQDRSDSDYGFLLSSIPTEQFKETYKGRAGISVSNGSKTASKDCDAIDSVVIGHFFYRKLTKRELVLTQLGRVLENDDKFDESNLPANDGVKDRRMVDDSTFWMRKFDGDGWIDEEEETVFSTIPLVAVYGNFKVIENKTLYRGAVRKLKDPQRVYNYAKSREIEEGALAPRAKYWMTTKQAEGDQVQATLRTLNTNHDPVQFYNSDGEVPPPQQQGGAQVNQGLNLVGETMRQLMTSTAGIFAAGMGDTEDFAQSGVAIDKLQDKSNNITTKYYSSLEVGICYTARLSNDAMHKVYDANRMQRLVGADGSSEMKQLFEEGKDENGDITLLNDLTAGQYDITCKAGPSYDSRQSQTQAEIMQFATAGAPEVLAMGLDVALRSSKSPQMDVLADRARLQMLNSGSIPQEEMTPEELQKLAEAQSQPPEPTVEMVLAQAEQAKADNDAQKNQLEAIRLQTESQLKDREFGIKEQELNLKGREQEIKIAEKSANLNLSADNQEFNQFMQVTQQQAQSTNDNIKNLNTQIDSLVKLFQATGADAVINTKVAEAYDEQAEGILKDQETT